MTENNNTFILFEEIKAALKGIESKLEQLPKTTDQQQNVGNNEPDLSSVKDAVAETTKSHLGEFKDLLAKQWKSYAQISTLVLQQLDALKKQDKGLSVQQESHLQEHIHRHSFDIKSSKVFSFVVGISAVCALSLWGNIEQWQTKRQYADDALKFRAIRSWRGCSANDILWLNEKFDYHRDERFIEWVRKQADGYETSLKITADSLMQESLKHKSD